MKKRTLWSFEGSVFLSLLLSKYIFWEMLKENFADLNNLYLTCFVKFSFTKWDKSFKKLTEKLGLSSSKLR